MGSDLLFLLRKLKTGSFVSILDTMLAEQPSAQGVLRVYLKTPNAPGQRAFLRCAASFFLEIRQYSCEKMSCATQKSLAAGHIMSFQIHPSIRRYVLPLLTSWKQNKSPGSIALQWIRAVRFHASSLSDTYGHRSRFRHYVLTPPIPFSQIIHRKTEPLPPCQCCLQRVALADSQGAADFLGDHDAAEVVDAPDNACCFHKLLLQCLSFCAGSKAIVCIRRRNMQVRNTTGHANRSCFVYRNFVEIMAGGVGYFAPFIVRLMRPRFWSTSRTATLTTSPTETTSDGCLMNLLLTCEICTSPS